MNTSKSRSSAAGGRGIARAALLLVPLALAACGMRGGRQRHRLGGRTAAQAPNKR